MPWRTLTRSTLHPLTPPGGFLGLLGGIKRGAIGVVVLPLVSLLEMSASTADSICRAVAGSSNVGWVRPPRWVWWGVVGCDGVGGFEVVVMHRCGWLRLPRICSLPSQSTPFHLPCLTLPNVHPRLPACPACLPAWPPLQICVAGAAAGPLQLA